jgi:hypothetical protein
MGGVGDIGGRLAAIGDAAHHARHVVARGLGGGQDVGSGVPRAPSASDQSVAERVPVRQ